MYACVCFYFEKKNGCDCKAYTYYGDIVENDHLSKTSNMRKKGDYLVSTMPSCVCVEKYRILGPFLVSGELSE